jgi:hypothetical protein
MTQSFLYGDLVNGLLLEPLILNMIIATQICNGNYKLLQYLQMDRAGMDNNGMHQTEAPACADGEL